MQKVVRFLAFGLAGIVLLGSAGPGRAADVAVEPEAIQALDTMSSYLRTLQQFRLTAVTTIDDVIEGGQLVETAGRAVYEVRRPDRLKLEVANDKQERVFYYDGKTITQFSPALGFYSVFDAPPTLGETIDLATDKYGISLPLADLFFWGTDRSNVKDITSAFRAPDSRISGETCTHYAYRTEGTDFQVWIRAHGDPLPCRLVIVTTDDEARPRYTATLEWDVDPLIGDTTFSFAPPPGAEKIVQDQEKSGDN